MDIAEVKVVEAQIMSLEEEMDGYRREAKRCKLDISALRLTLRRRLMNQNQTEIELPAPPSKSTKH